MTYNQECNQDYPPLPKNLPLYEHQIGGHGLVYEKIGKVLCGSDNTVFKPVQAFPKGWNEIKFYRDVFDSKATDPDIIAIRKFVPGYKGLFYEHETHTHYFCMEDILSDIKHPSVIDVKMGAISFAPDSTPAKEATERAKYLYREQVGFLITGLKVYHPRTKETEFFDRFHGRSLDPEKVYTEGIRMFLGKDGKRACQLARIFLSKLWPLKEWFDRQTKLSFFASSLLLGYDSDSPRFSIQDDQSQRNLGERSTNHSSGADAASSCNETTLKNCNGQVVGENSLDCYPHDDVVLRWVDFTHSVPTNGKKDENFNYGLHNLITFFERVLREES